MNNFFKYFKQTKAVYIILLSVIVNGIGGLINQFITLILKNDLNISNVYVSVIVSITLAAAMLGTLIGGKLTDKYNPKKIKLISTTSFGIMNIIIAFIGAKIEIVPLLIISSFIIGFAGATNSLLILIHAKKEDRKNAFSLVYVAINVAAAISPIIAAYVYKTLGFFMLFFIDGITTLISAALIFTLPNKELKEKKETKKVKQSIIKIFKENKTILLTQITISLYFIAFSQIKAVLPFQTSEIFKNNYAEIFAIMLSINGIMCMIIPPFISVYLKKISSKNMLILNGFLYIVGFFMYSLTKNQYVFYIATAIWTLGEIAGAIEFEVYIAENSPVSHKGQILSFNPIMRKVGQMLGILLGGILSQTFKTNYIIIWGIIVLFPFLGTILIRLSHKNKIV